MKEKYCEYCFPEKPRHFFDKFTSSVTIFLVDPLYVFIGKILNARNVNRLGKILEDFMIKFFFFFNLLERVTEIEREYYPKRALTIWDEAKKRNLDISSVVFGKGKKYLNIFCWEQGNKKHYFKDSPVFEFDDIRPNDILVDDKARFKAFLIKNGLPCADGGCFFSMKKAIKHGLEIGWPLVVKPVASSLSRHAIVKIDSREKLVNAIKIAKQIGAKVVVEKFVEGNVYRAVVLAGCLIAVAKRLPANIVGDGVNVVEKLIKQKNLKLKTDSQIVIDENLIKMLGMKNKNLGTILSFGERLELSGKVTVRSGGEIHNETDFINAETKKMFEKLQLDLNIPYCGFDFICQDVSRSYLEQNFAIIENNTLPFIEMHHEPDFGEPIDVARMVWDYVIEKEKELVG
ncbi:hypothetical protein A2533_00255 [Candidatus Falkowbacteria bacterium RIFOXYD2_FULL_35_9]|uniref:ATP-grasp domain-containing protein n=1 Tax=Candidatus Falkowbacteria bacterium RIFOXYC2_FULL_36_12 TaxID=1798002 RepID=A0A1F5T3B3_9BACT|nr:MAG: hypothetical protein A2300_04295 [Candidatus Falkowbacteria bacterium RIFOXYB2_FULL_35_7]OGF33454.1 MAG: hypothetical protein A2478_02055 [Candidatus Falkowbacteria bacterium RIFOXYC2_FULL_36_12]OGF34102.1 MAG: hypothetical protein A2223_01565 [Candidatus Falkowbacteria bacterium RIFOXYA2_FULL_35_8]OGF46011.1 MAG: hypothetical protein A2533_00255 [Candidatus Falkowbacteria bacterium RIFOXYD2_FULL_35_9]